ncbi:MAG: prolyl oligopeptidase family serine peptidase [Gemmatimonadales bacterium]
MLTKIGSHSRLLAAQIALSTLSSAAVAQSAPAAIDGKRISGAHYRLPAYETLPDGVRRELDQTATRLAYDSTRRDHNFILERVRYWSDGLSVVAYVYQPALHPSRPRPAIIYSRGSYVAGDLAPVLAPMLHRLALEGYTIVAPQYRGSDGGDGKDEMGGADVDDVLNAVRLAASLPGIDSARMFLYGESRGGMMTYQAIRARAPVKAAAVVGAFADLDSLLANDPRSRGAATQIWPDYASRSAEIANKRSADRWAGDLTVPLLILHGGADPQVSPRQALRLALKLDELGRTYELHVFAGGSHTLFARAAERDAAVAAWFRRY